MVFGGMPGGDRGKLAIAAAGATRRVKGGDADMRAHLARVTETAFLSRRAEAAAAGGVWTLVRAGRSRTN
jgi:hypothetical protein